MLQAKDTGQLSLITAGMSTAGAVARIFTSIQEGAGLSMVRGFCIGKVPVLLLQTLCKSCVSCWQTLPVPCRRTPEPDNYTANPLVCQKHSGRGKEIGREERIEGIGTRTLGSRRPEGGITFQIQKGPQPAHCHHELSVGSAFQCVASTIRACKHGRSAVHCAVRPL